MGVRDKPTAPRSPRQNPYVERLIGTIRRECLDHMIVFGGRTCAGSWVGMPRIIMNRAFIARWTRMPHSIGRLSASATSHHSLSSAAFIPNIAASDFRHAQDFERGLLFLPESKTGKKTVVLNAPALAVIKGLDRVGQYVVAGEDPDE